MFDEPSQDTKPATVVDIKIPFWSMVTLMVEWALASIPAIIILVVIGMVVSAVIGGLFHHY